VGLLLIAGCGESIPVSRSEEVTRAEAPRILAMGDSMLAWRRESHQSISDAIEHELNEPVVDRSVIAARYNYALPISGALGLNISKQYREGNWDWVVLNGGGNDLWFGCGCVACDGTIDKLIASDSAAGKIPELVSRIRSTGARVIYLGYLHSPGVYSIVDHCKAEDVELEKRIAQYAAKHRGVYFFPSSRLVPVGDRSFHSIDMIHPSIKASRVIGEEIAKIIRSAKE
jgi:lysophospholipase L1-like esterase